MFENLTEKLQRTFKNLRGQGKLTEEKKAEIAETIPLARLGRAEDIAGACVFLASDLSLYCTGITLDVNGGMLIH